MTPPCQEGDFSGGVGEMDWFSMREGGLVLAWSWLNLVTALTHAIGHAGATVHVETYALGLPIYELTAIVLIYSKKIRIKSDTSGLNF